MSTAAPSTAAEIQQTDVLGVSAEEAIDRLVARAVAMGASDLFLNASEHEIVAEVRHLGVVRQIATLNRDQGKRAVAYIRNNAGMSMGDLRRPDEGRWIWTPEARENDGTEDVEVELDNSVDLRVSVIPTLHGEDAAMRLLVRSSTLYDLEKLGMTAKQLGKYRQMIGNPGGLVLICGPTGSGKTATLYATLMRLNDGTRKINTIEDPIEYAVEGLRQSQVNDDIEMDFGDLLRAVLRQNPDVIMVGEVRDAETAMTAVRAAASGILVFATLHAPSTASAIQSMRAYGVPDHFLANGLRGVVAQRLVRTLDPTTRQKLDLGTEAFEEVRDLLGPDEGNSIYAAVPAESNHMSGYAGRTGVFEVMQVTPAIRALIANNAPARSVRDQAIKDGMVEFRKAALLAVARGETTTEEVFRVIPTEELLHEE
jgi:type II secretory ATPase GspE/PulE/Tfp pilus assembly ATPase PilB-like protein